MKISASVFAALLLTLLAASAWSQEPAKAQGPLPEGETVYVPSRPAADQKGIDAAIERSIAEFNVLFRSFARGKLEEITAISKTVRFVKAGDVLAIAPAGVKVMKGDVTVKSFAFTNEEGEPLRAGIAVKGRKVVQSYWHEKGNKFVTYTFSEDGAKMRMAIRITSPRMEVPLNYTVNYIKKK